MSNQGNQEEIVTVTGTESNDAGLQDTNIKEKLGKMIGINKGNIKAKFKQAQKVLLSKMKAIILQVATGAITEKVSSSMCERMDSINSLRDRLNSFASTKNCTSNTHITNSNCSTTGYRYSFISSYIYR